MPVSPSESGRAASLGDRLARPNPYLLANIGLCLSLMISPFIYYWWDVLVYYLPWARATAGVMPWGVYQATAPYDYPPFVSYLVTLSERFRLLLNAPAGGPVDILLLKAPNLLANWAGVPLCLIGLRRPLGDKGARIAANLYALCLPLYVNAVVWGQFDALLSLAVAMTAIALLNDRPLRAGAAAGWALSIKFNVMVAVPALLVYVGRRYGVKRLAASMMVGLLVLAAVVLPHVLAGATEELVEANLVNRFLPQRADGAQNAWYLLDRFDVWVRKIPEKTAIVDSRPALGPLTFRQIGQAAYAAYLLFLLAGLWRRPTAHNLMLTAAMSVFGMFMLLTQIRERYIIPAVIFLALAAPQSRRALLLFAGLSLTSSLNQLAVATRHYFDGPDLLSRALYLSTRLVGTPVALTYIVLFVWGTYIFWQTVYADLAQDHDRPSPREDGSGVLPRHHERAITGGAPTA